MNKEKMISAIVIWACSLSVHALVDYTEQEFEKPQMESKSSNVRQVESRPNSFAGDNRGGLIQNFALSSSMESLKVDINDQTKKVERDTFNLYLQSNFNVFMNVNYWMAKSDSDLITQSPERQSGNPTVKLGFNWLRFGESNEMMTVDLIGGMMLKGSSDFASSRNDQILGLETTKRFYNVAFGLGLEYRIVGDVSNEQELQTGNINRFQAALGWKVSPDINLSLEANYFKIQAGSDALNGSMIQKGFTFSYLTPKLSLALSRFLGLELGAHFRTKKVVIDESVLHAKLWDLPGLYGNSIWAGLSILF